MKELIEWLEDAYVSDGFCDSLDKEHSTTGQTPEYWSEKNLNREKAYDVIRNILKNLEDDELAEKYRRKIMETVSSPYFSPNLALTSQAVENLLLAYRKEIKGDNNETL